MKKIFFSLAIFLSTFSYTNAQSFTLEWNGEPLDGDSITILPDSATALEILFEAVVYNNTGGGANVKVVKNELVMLEGSSSYLCMDSCYETSIDTTVMFMFIPAGGSIGEGAFSGHYEISDAVGVSVVEYSFFNIDNPDDNVRVFVKFDTSPASISENIMSNTWVSEIYPNPAINFVSIDYKLPNEVRTAGVKIVNLLGSVVMEEQVDTRNTNMRMNISNLVGGIYFYTLFVNGELYSTKKLIIR